jgi:hypothetical protein
MLVERCSAEAVSKRAQDDEERDRLEREGRILPLVSHPGVVQVLAVEDGRLRLRAVSRELAQTSGFRPEEVLGLGATLATTLADLHHLGFAHGAIEVSHVLLEEDGYPVLCSFGRAVRLDAAGDPEAARCRDVRQLADLLLELLPPGASPRVVRTLRAARESGRRTPNARRLARALIEHAPDARLPDRGRAQELPPTRGDADEPVVATQPMTARRVRRGRRLAVAAVLGSAAAMAVVAVARSTVTTAASEPPHPLVTHKPAAWARPAHPAARGPVPCPPVDAGCRPVSDPDGVLTTAAGQFRIGTSGDIAVLGRWSCTPTATPAVLRPATGQVWTYDRWASARSDVAPRSVGQVAGAVALRVAAGPDGCDTLVVTRRSGPPVDLIRRGT